MFPLFFFAARKVSRIAIVKPEKARAIEDMVIQMAQRGQLAAKIDEDKLIELLSRAGETEEKQRTKVTVRDLLPLWIDAVVSFFLWVSNSRPAFFTR